MLHRTTSSRRRRASRSAGTGSTSSPQRGTQRVRRASVAVGASDSRSPTKDDEEATTHNRSPRGSIGGGDFMEFNRISPRNSLIPDFQRNPRNSLVPDSQRSPRNSLVPDSQISPRNALIPDSQRSPRNSLVPDFQRSPRNSLILDSQRSPRNSLVPDSQRSPRNSLIPDSQRSPRNSLVPDSQRSPRNSLVPDSQRSPRNSLVPDSQISPRNALIPDSQRSPRNSLVPDFQRSPRNSLIPDSQRSPRNSLVPDSQRSPRNSLIPDSQRSPRNSLVPDSQRSPRNSLVADGTRSQRNSITPEIYNKTRASAAGIIEAAFERGAGFMDTSLPGPSRGLPRSPSPYRMSVSARGAQINLGYTGGSAWSDVGSRRASSNVSQVSSDDRRHLCERTKLSSEVGLTAYGSVVYQLKDANMEASGSCDFVCRAMVVVYKTVVVTVALVCLASLPLLMLIMGVQFLRDCPAEPHVPVYMLVGGSFGAIKMLWMIWRQIRSRRYERLDLTTPVSSMDEGTLTPSAGSRLVSAALSFFLVVWFALGNFWILHIAWPDYEPALYDPNSWCHKTLYIFAIVHLIVVYSVLAVLLLIALSLMCCHLLACPLIIRFK